jgi:tRNA-methyltransferase O
MDRSISLGQTPLPSSIRIVSRPSSQYLAASRGMSSSRRQPSSQPRDGTVLLLLVTSTVVVSIATTLLTSYRHRQDIKRLQQEWENRRQEERTGRIRAEVKLRTLLKEQQRQQHQLRQLPEIDVKNKMQHAVPVAPPPPRTMLLHCIGTVTSPFTKRMGTPRQPALVPASRGYVEFNQHAAAALLDGIEHYSHLWVIFEFHANTCLVQVR